MKHKLSCYIIDDEHLAQEILEEYIAKVPFLELKGTFFSPLEAAEKLAEDKPDLLFLDINMPDLDGLSFIPMLNPKPMIILTTAYDQYALKAYELEVKDYLVKPISFERFYKGVLRLYQESGLRIQPEIRDINRPAEQNRAEQNPAFGIGQEFKEAAAHDSTQANHQSAKPAVSHDSDHLFLKVGHRIQKIAISDILFVEGMKDYLRIHTHTEKFMTLLNFAKLEELLPAKGYARVHRSYLVAISKIDHIEKNRIRIGSEIIPISDTYAEGFFKLLKGI